MDLIGLGRLAANFVFPPGEDILIDHQDLNPPRRKHAVLGLLIRVFGVAWVGLGHGTKRWAKVGGCVLPGGDRVFAQIIDAIYAEMLRFPRNRDVGAGDQGLGLVNSWQDRARCFGPVKEPLVQEANDAGEGTIVEFYRLVGVRHRRPK